MDKNIFRVMMAAMLLLMSLSAKATLLFEIERLSGTTARVTATGTLTGPPPVLNTHQLHFGDPYGIGPTGLDNRDVFLSSTMQVGSVPIDAAYVLGPDQIGPGEDPWLYILNSSIIGFVGLDAPVTVTGAIFWELPTDLSLAELGSTGPVNWGYGPITNSGGGSRNVGSWVMVAAPIPVPAPLTLLALGLVFIGRRRKHALHATGKGQA